MAGQDSKQNLSTVSTNLVTTTTKSTDIIHPRQWIAQNFLLIWTDTSNEESKQDHQNILAQLGSVVNDMNIFTQRDEGIDFLTEVDGRKAFLIVEDTIGQHMVPLIHNIPQLDTIYVYSDMKSGDEQWTKEWFKIKGVYTEITSISQALQMAVKQYNQDSIAVSFVKVDRDASCQQSEST